MPTSTVQTVDSLIGTYYVTNGTGAITAITLDYGIETVSSIPVTTKTANYTFTLGDRATVVEGNATGGLTFTIPLLSSMGTGTAQFVPGNWIMFSAISSGMITIQGQGGVTLRQGGSGYSTLVSWARGLAHMRAANDWVIII